MMSLQHRAAAPARFHPAPTTRRAPFVRLSARQAVDEKQQTAVEDAAASTSGSQPADVTKDLARSINKTATTFAPRSSTAKGKNPAQKGTLLYDVFEWQAWLSLAAGGLLSFNIIWPTDEPSIPRLLGMWSIWMFTIPSLRAKECMPREKEALNVLFLAIPLMNVMLPFVWKSFGFIFACNTVAILGTYYQKGVWREVYGLPLGPELPPPEPAAEGEGEQQQQQAAQQ